MPTLTDAELDTVYTQLCKTMTQIGEANAPLFLARLTLLAITRLGDAQLAQQLIADAALELATAGAVEG